MTGRALRARLGAGVRGLAIAAALCAAHFVPAALAAEPTSTTVLLIRHAEKNAHAPGGDAGLSTPGLVRARALVRALHDAGVSAIFASTFARARLTAEPLALALGDSVRLYDPNDVPALARRIREDWAGTTVLVVGHSDTIPDTIRELGGPTLSKKEDIPYDRLFVLVLDEGHAPRLLRLTYGSPP